MSNSIKLAEAADALPYGISNPNILINPSFTVKQRGDVIDHNIASYGPDRWRFRGLDSVKGTMVQSSTDSTTGTNKLVVKHRNATSFAYVYQSIEVVNLLGLYGKEMTLSFSYSDTGGSGIPYVQINCYDSSNTNKQLFSAAPTSLGNNRWTCTFTLSTNDGTVQDPNELGTNVIIYPNEKNAAPSEWSVWETKLEVGSVATPFIARSHGEELALCQRYYWQNTTNGAYYAYQYVSSNRMLLVPFPVPMRATPTATIVMSGGSFASFGSDEYQYKAYNGSAYTDTVPYNTSSVKFDAEL